MILVMSSISPDWPQGLAPYPGPARISPAIPTSMEGPLQVPGRSMTPQRLTRTPSSSEPQKSRWPSATHPWGGNRTKGEAPVALCPLDGELLGPSLAGSLFLIPSPLG